MQYSIHLLRHARLNIGQNIHRLRAAQHLPLCKLARLSGVPLVKLDQYELGKNEINVADLFRISCALKVEMHELMR